MLERMEPVLVGSREAVGYGDGGRVGSGLPGQQPEGVVALRLF